MKNTTDLTEIFELDLHAELVEEAKKDFVTYKALIRRHKALNLALAFWSTYYNMPRV